MYELILSVHGKESFCLSHVAVPNPDLEIRGGAVIQTLDKGGPLSPQKIFSALQASV